MNFHVTRMCRKWSGAALAVAGMLGGAGWMGQAAGAAVVGSGPGGRQYELVMDPVASWGQAASAAEAAGGFLATIGDAGEQAAVERLLTDAGAPAGSYWFGLHEDGSGRYVNVNGVAQSYTHWLADTRQPDDLGGAETSASILWSHPGDPTIARLGYWNDLPAAGGYPQVESVYPDLVSRGYVIERLDDRAPGGGGSFENGDGDSTRGGGNPSAVPLPTGVALFPAGAALTALVMRRSRRVKAT